MGGSTTLPAGFVQLMATPHKSQHYKWHGSTSSFVLVEFSSGSVLTEIKCAFEMELCDFSNLRQVFLMF